MTERVCIVPCSGIGKTYGSVTREAAYIVTEELRPDTAQIVPLSLLVLGDGAAREALAGAPVITLDGCKLGCATLNVRQAGGAVAKEYAVLDFYRAAPAAQAAGHRRAERRRASAGPRAGRGRGRDLRRR